MPSFSVLSSDYSHTASPSAAFAGGMWSAHAQSCFLIVLAIGCEHQLMCQAKDTGVCVHLTNTLGARSNAVPAALATERGSLRPNGRHRWSLKDTSSTA
eukprot:480471-Amphidinium_carterae.1